MVCILHKICKFMLLKKVPETTLQLYKLAIRNLILGIGTKFFKLTTIQTIIIKEINIVIRNL